MKRVIIPLLLLAISCDLYRPWSAPCRDDDFFCQSPEQQAEQLASLSDGHLLKVSRINYRYFMPPSDGYAQEIADRRGRGLAIMTKLRRGSEVDEMLFRDTARIFRARGLELCDPVYAKELTELCAITPR